LSDVKIDHVDPDALVRVGELCSPLNPALKGTPSFVFDSM
jgi:hypothetical protein